jgi:hypothetical protein
LSRFLERQPLAIRAERRWVLKVSADRQRFRLAAAVGTNLNHALAGCATAQQTSSTVEDAARNRTISSMESSAFVTAELIKNRDLPIQQKP